MKVVLFCGGMGMRLREYSQTIPKPLVNIGFRPILWNLMKYYSHYGHKEFILCLGHGGDMIREYFLEYSDYLSTDFTMVTGSRQFELHGADTSDWRITFVDTGIQSNIGTRLCRVREYVDGEAMFLANYSDGLTDLDLDRMVSSFDASDAIASFAAVHPSNSLSKVELDEATGVVKSIDYLHDSIYINGGFFALRSEIFDYIEEGEELVEEPFRRLIDERKLLAWRHEGFWRAMDTFKDKMGFDNMYESGDRPWEVWS